MGEATRCDDTSIRDNDRLFRRVQPHPSHLVVEADGSKRLSSAVFKDPELSVNIESVMVAQGRKPEETVAGFPGYYLTSVTAGDVRRFDLERGDSHPIVRDPEPPSDSAHGLILGKKTNAFANEMKRIHRWIIPP